VGDALTLGVRLYFGKRTYELQTANHAVAAIDHGTRGACMSTSGNVSYMSAA
jgi:hypothetical protein